MELGAGAALAGYRIERTLGGGGMGTVYLARHPRLPRRDALKVLDTRLAADPTFRARFEREADLAARLQHPNIVQIYDRGVDGDRLWIAMQYVDGSDAAQLLRQGLTVLSAERAVRIVRKAARGIDHAHRQGLLHRDIKPANLLVARADDGTDAVLVTDFGIARSMGETTALTSAGSVLGTLAYAAPEQLEGRPLDARTDIYALGCTLYELLTGFVPFPREGPAAQISAHLLEPPPRPSLADPALPPVLDAVIARAMAKNPADRFPTCAALAEAAVAAFAATRGSDETTADLSSPTGPSPHPADSAPTRESTRPSESARPSVAGSSAAGSSVAGSTRKRAILVGAGVLAVAATVAVIVTFVRGDRVPSNLDPGTTATSSTTTSPVTIGAVPNNPDAANTLRPWLADVVAGNTETLVRNCWTHPPSEIPRMYGAVDEIVDAVARPGIPGLYGAVWQNDRTRVSLSPNELQSDYGCPVVGDRTMDRLGDEHARYTVERYLSRVVGDPVNPADVETDYPLLCDAADPGAALTGIRRFDEHALTVRDSTNSVVRIDAPTSAVDGTSTSVTFTLIHVAQGFCVLGIAPSS
ncbi:protein kinase [Nocardia sp. NPDC058176]|uniref:serine/threonine-protein kinase n=1 Tax=Nocardia sp. NPDC058176 TaxID=3346368 RepID=UPI0036D7F85B